MKAKARPRFDIDALRDLAGDKVFARGEAYCRGGQVQILVLEPGRVLAQVAGTEDYRTELTGRGKEIDGACSCPAFEDWGFCKHMVAAALAANAAGSDTEAEGALPRIRDHLKKKGVDALVEMIVNLAERDPALFRKLDMAAAAVHADDKTLEARLSKAIDRAIRTNGFVDYRGALDWRANVDAVLDTIADLASRARNSRPRASLEPPRLVYVGQLIRRKGIHLLLNVFARLRGHRPDAELWLVGDGPERSTLKDQASAAGLGQAVRFFDRVENDMLPDLLTQCDVFVFPSLEDTYAVVIPEAMIIAIGVPRDFRRGFFCPVRLERTAKRVRLVVHAAAAVFVKAHRAVAVVIVDGTMRPIDGQRLMIRS